MKFSGGSTSNHEKNFTTQKLKKSPKFMSELSGRIGGINRQYHEKLKLKKK
jgi:hypothetical protein